MHALGIQSAPSVSTGVMQMIQVWPNPVRDEFRISAGAQGTNCHWSALDLTGREIADGKGASPLRVVAQQWPVGAFLLRVESEDGSVRTFRLIKG